MGKFEIEGYAKRKVKCDIAELYITFWARGVNPTELQKRVMDECDRFLDNVFKLPIKSEDVRFGADRVSASNYQNKDEIEAERIICISMPFDLRFINRVQAILQEYSKVAI